MLETHPSNNAGKSLYRGNVHYRLFSCQSTLSLAIEKQIVYSKKTYLEAD